MFCSAVAARLTPAGLARPSNGSAGTGDCVASGFTLNADHNAALNILAAGQAVTAQGGSGVTPARELRTDRQVKRLRPAA